MMPKPTYDWRAAEQAGVDAFNALSRGRRAIEQRKRWRAFLALSDAHSIILKALNKLGSPKAGD